MKRVPIFEGGKVSASGSGDALKAIKAGDDWNVEGPGDEHYRTPEAVISGG